ncbi:MAG: DNA/RNA nuclease SfsA [Deltaproteobacteria bacterium]|nr:DNA/RNA nuclease SfsA [Candidatus Anaeroferrophillacea bacterium]
MTTESLSAAPPPAALPWPPLVRGTLVRRYKRFLADVMLDDGRDVTAHCPNSGSMHTCATPGRPVWLSATPTHSRRRLAWTWEIIDMPSSPVGVNTQVPNRLVHRAVECKAIPALAGYETCRREVPYGTRSRIDLLLTGHRAQPPSYVEVKNCTLVENDGIARFPDAVTSRGRKHLEELAAQVAAGNRGVMLFLIQRMDARGFRPADDIDPDYGETLRRVYNLGVELLAFDVTITRQAISLRREVPIHL